jgi:hypothetical protein
MIEWMLLHTVQKTTDIQKYACGSKLIDSLIPSVDDHQSLFVARRASILSSMMVSRNDSLRTEKDSDDADEPGELAALLEDLNPLVRAALQEHWDWVAEKVQDHHPHVLTGATAVVVVAHDEDAKEDEDDHDRGNPNKNEKSKQGALEETMGRLRLADSIKRSAREYSNQQRSPAFDDNTIVALPLTKPCDAAQVLHEKGVVRLGGVLSESTCDSIAKAICSELDAAITKGRDLIPGRGEGFGNFGTGFGFGASRMKEQRWDMYLPLEGE